MSMSRKSFGIVLPIALLSYFLILMDNSIVFTSSREIGADLGLDAVGMAVFYCYPVVYLICWGVNKYFKSGWLFLV